MADELPIGQQLRTARVRAQIGVCELSERGGISRQTINDVERGVIADPSERVVLAYVTVCKLNGTPADTLFVSANHAPPDLFKAMKEDPQLCQDIRHYICAILTKEG